MENKQRPILFSTAMVQAILAGRKTQTRRVVKPQPESVNVETPIPIDRFLKKLKDMTDKGLEHIKSGTSGLAFPKCPYGQPGDVLWVRETWQPSAIGAYVHFKADCIDTDPGKGWKPSIHMPKDACRLFLRITNVRVERLQEISRKDAAAEGVCIESESQRFPGYQTHRWPEENFQILWENINGEESWNENPFVWVLEFERIQQN
jgi:hypothetical protein